MAEEQRGQQPSQTVRVTEGYKPQSRQPGDNLGHQPQGIHTIDLAKIVLPQSSAVGVPAATASSPPLAPPATPPTQPKG